MNHVNGRPFSAPVTADAPIERAMPFYRRASLHEMDAYGWGWSFDPAPSARIRRACEEDDARYMEAVLR